MKTFKYSITVLAGILIIVGNASALTVTSPNGGETWIIGHTHPITWDYSGPDSRLKLELIKEGVRVGTIAENIQAGQKRFLWKVGNYIGGRAFGGDGYKIRATIMNSTDSDSSNGPFTLANVLGPPLQEQKPSQLEKKPSVEIQKERQIVLNLPDLICESITISPQNPREGDIVGPIVVTIKNKGLSTAPPSTAAFVCLHEACFPTECVGCKITHEMIIDQANGWEKRFSVPSIRAGESVQFTFRPVPDHQPGQHPDSPRRKWVPGGLLFRFWVDIDKSVNEGGEGEANNYKELRVIVPKVGVPGPPVK